MPLIFLIRHGENDHVKTGRLAGRLPNVHLNDTGREQARLLVEHFARFIPAAPAEAPKDQDSSLSADSGSRTQTDQGAKAPMRQSTKSQKRQGSHPPPTIKAIYSSPLERAMETAAPLSARLNIPVIECPGLIETDYGEWQDQKLKGLGRTKLWKVVQSAPSVARFPGGELFADAQMRIVNTLLDLSTRHEQNELIVCVSHADPIKLAVAYFIGLPLDMFQRLSVSPGSISALALGEFGGHLLSLNTQPGPAFNHSA